MLNLNTTARDLFEEIKTIPVIDAHEHLRPESVRVATKIDALTLFSHYCKGDLEAAGLPQGPEQDEIFDTEKPIRHRWETFRPYYDAIKYGSYARPALYYIRDILGFDDLNENTIEAISLRLQTDNQPGHYRTILDACGIERALICGQTDPDNTDRFRYLFYSLAAGFGDASKIEELEQATGHDIHTLDEAVQCIREYPSIRKAQGAVGMKVGMAYYRKIEFDDVPASLADPLFHRLRNSMHSKLSAAEQEILENFFLRREIEGCQEAGLPVAIHTGYQAGNRNDIRNARAIHLWSLLKSYPKARFDLFHGSFPYVEDMAVLGKYFRNVCLNMCWMHIMSPEISRRALREWLDMVPVTKIFAFGGDYGVIEKVPGHLHLAQENIASVLAEKTDAGLYSHEDALFIARQLFYENPKNWYNLP